MSAGELREVRAGARLALSNLSLFTTDEELHNYFIQFGSLTECSIARTVDSGWSRGFGFVTYRDEEAVNRCLRAAPHFVRGTRVNITRMGFENRTFANSVSSNVILVSLLGTLNVTESTIIEHFSHAGKIRFVEWGRGSKEKRLPYVFLHFHSPEAVKLCMSARHHLNGVPVVVRKIVRLEAVKLAEQREREEIDRAARDAQRQTTSEGGQPSFVGATYVQNAQPVSFTTSVSGGTTNIYLQPVKLVSSVPSVPALRNQRQEQQKEDFKNSLLNTASFYDSSQKKSLL